MNKVDKLMESLDLAIDESDKPILIEGMSGIGVVSSVQNNYNTVSCTLAYDFFGKSIERKFGMPDWYKELYELCKENQDKKCLALFEGFGLASRDVLLNFLDEVVVNQNSMFPLPENAKLVCYSDKMNLIPSEYLKYFTVVGTHDKSAVDEGFHK